MHHFLYPKMQTCLEIEKLIQRNAKTDICRNWRFLYQGLILQPLFTAGGALVGLAYYYFVRCPTGACPLTSNPFITMAYMGFIGWLLSGIFGKGCSGSCNTQQLGINSSFLALPIRLRCNNGQPVFQANHITESLHRQTGKKEVFEFSCGIQRGRIINDMVVNVGKAEIPHLLSLDHTHRN